MNTIKKNNVINVVEAWNPPVDWIKQKIEQAGNLIGSVHFYKRSDNSLRKMSYRLHVKKPSIAKAPKQKNETSSNIRKDINNKNNQMTVFDVNKVMKNVNGRIIVRGMYRTIPLDRVIKICNNGTVYNIYKN